jgi:hypothetical protein
MGMAHGRLSSLHTILEDSVDEFDTTSSGGSPDFHIYQKRNTVTPSIPIKTTLLPEGTPMPLTIATVPLWTIVLWLDTDLPPE